MIRLSASAFRIGRWFHRTRLPRRSRQSIGWMTEALESRLLLAIGPVGPAFRVNADTGNRVSATDVAADAAGEFVVVWDAVSDDEATASAVSS